MWDYWSSYMNWPLDPDWKCQTCGCDHPSLTWGFVHGTCRCNVCHTIYTMQPDGKRVTVPVCIFKNDYILAIRAGWQEFKQPISLWTEAMWDTAKNLATVEA